ncbi:MAG TPA: alpha-mannosidase, partial [Candidatus Hydrogenedentes bacterium]|nr:alpha-mannosidase [Candidatus Hydrogenedentota bacterium]
MAGKSPKKTVHMIGHGHIDPTWLWRWTEGYEEVRATFRSALDRMNETPEFRFTASSACFYAWVKECDPEMFEEIRQRVKEGRWEVAGGWWVEPDCNLPEGESFVRHGLYSQGFLQREFGIRARVGFNPDSFGHAGTLPQIYKKMGIDYY